MTVGIEYASKEVRLDSYHSDFLALLWRNGGTKAAQQRRKAITH